MSVDADSILAGLERRASSRRRRTVRGNGPARHVPAITGDPRTDGATAATVADGASRAQMERQTGQERSELAAGVEPATY